MDVPEEELFQRYSEIDTDTLLEKVKRGSLTEAADRAIRRVLTGRGVTLTKNRLPPMTAEKFFSETFERVQDNARKKRGADLEISLEVSLQEAVTGHTTHRSYEAYGWCGTCEGTGADPSSHMIDCDQCDGTGVRWDNNREPIACGVCNFTGLRPSSLCQTCNGDGLVLETRTVSVNVPAGVDTGDRIRLTGQGSVAKNAEAAGELYFCVSVTPHHAFQRRGAALYCDLSIPPEIAANGGSTIVDTLWGRIELQIPLGTQNGQVLKVAGKGAREISGIKRESAISIAVFD